MSTTDTQEQTETATDIPTTEEAKVGDLVVDEPLSKGNLAAALERRKINESTWRTLCDSVFPGAQPKSIMMAIDYCIARKLDVLKKPCHIVPMHVSLAGQKDGQGKQKKVWRDIIMPGIYELRTTAMRTREYAGIEEVEFGEPKEFLNGGGPEWAKVTVYRLLHGQKVAFTAKVFFVEAAATTGYGADERINSMWLKRPRGQLAKCAEAAALRMAFPEEIGGEHVADEMMGQHGDPPSDPLPDDQPEGPKPTNTRTMSLKDSLKASIDQAGRTPPPSDAGTPKRDEWAGMGGDDRGSKTVKTVEKKPAYTIETAIAALRAPQTSKDLKDLWDKVAAAFPKEIPVDVDAFYQTRLEMLQEAGK